MGKNQALPGDLSKPADLAAAIAGVLLKRPETSSRMREALVVALERSTSFDSTKAAVKVIIETGGFSAGQIDRLEAAIAANDQVGSYFSIHKRLQNYISQARAPR